MSDVISKRFKGLRNYMEDDFNFNGYFKFKEYLLEMSFMWKGVKDTWQIHFSYKGIKSFDLIHYFFFFFVILKHL